MVRIKVMWRLELNRLWLVVLIVLCSCGRNERMDTLYAQRCMNCHGPSGRGDGPIAASLPVRLTDFRETVERKSVAQIRRAITEGEELMPAFEPALRPSEISDLVYMVRFLSREGRDIHWWEHFDALVVAHCSIPWEAVFDYDQPQEEKQR
ncbi:MAG: c-type cytochrome [Alphaproteobacteria bacterium]